MAQTKYVTVASMGKLAALGGLLGPITTPCHLDISVIIALINDGKVVYEVNPANISDRVRLTRANVLASNFNKAVVLPKKPEVKPTKVEVKPQPVKAEVKKEVKKIEVKEIEVETEERLNGIDIFITNNHA